jgi:hypothetical protein
MKTLLLVLILLFASLGCNFHSSGESIQKSTNKKVTKNATDSVDLNYDIRIKELKSSLTDDFIYVKDSYFLIVSNLDDAQTRNISEGTVDRTVQCFYNGYLDAKPTELTTIFLFKNDATYRYWAKKLYDDDDLSRFGYYKPASKVMLMNINTGSGTLVHEMTHALVRYDFPDIPSWFNEGLGSLYERCSLNGGEILGYVNWRLPRLKEAVADGSYLSLESLMTISDDNFYDKQSDLNYAEARYLCMYMQERGVLKKFYHAFRDGYDKDKSGITYIESVFGKKLKDIEKDYITWVKTLRYEE